VLPNNCPNAMIAAMFPAVGEVAGSAPGLPKDAGDGPEVP
jgi:hypothetical protein